MAVTNALAVGTRERGEAAAWQSLSVHNETQNWLTIQQTLPIQRSSRAFKLCACVCGKHSKNGCSPHTHAHNLNAHGTGEAWNRG